MRGPEYMQINIQCCIREIRKKLILFSQNRSLSLCPEIERKIDELRELVVMFHQSTTENAEEPTEDRPVPHLNFHRKAGLYHKTQKRLAEHYSNIFSLASKEPPPSV